MKAYALVTRLPGSERDKLIIEHMEVATRIALRVARRVPDWVTHEDLLGAAMVGLTEAANRYDAGRTEPFVAFAEKRIRGAVIDELRRGDMMPRRVRSRARQVGEAIARLVQTLGREPEDEEVAAYLDVGVDEYRVDLALLTQMSIVEFEPLEGSGKHGQAPASDCPRRRAERSLLLSRIQESLKELPRREALMLSLYYMEQLTYSEIGQVLGVSESRICQIHGRAIARLRLQLNDGNDQ